MLRLLIRRLLTAIPTLLLVAVIVFAMRLIIPGGPEAAIAGENATPEVLANIRHQLGLDKPLPIQFWDWLVAVFRGDLGTSTSTHEPVRKILFERLPATTELVLGTIVLALLVGGAAGVWAAIHRHRADGKITFALAGFALSVPDFWLATLGAGLFGLSLDWVPAVGYTPITEDLGENIRSVILPVLILTTTTGALICRHIRSAMSRELVSVHVRTAWALGLRPIRVYLGDAMRASLGPIITYVPLAIAGLVGAAVVVENVFNIPGLGTAIVQAVDNRDYPTLQGIVFVLAVMVIVLNLLADLAHALMDPRARAGVKS